MAETHVFKNNSNPEICNKNSKPLHMYNRRHVTLIHTNLAIKTGNNPISNKVNRYVIHVYITECSSAVES